MTHHKTMEIVLGVALLLSAVSVPYPLVRRGVSPLSSHNDSSFRVQIMRLDELNRQAVSQQNDLDRLRQQTQALVQILGDASANPESVRIMPAAPQRAGNPRSNRNLDPFNGQSPY